jgi:hypothetical protein
VKTKTIAKQEQTSLPDKQQQANFLEKSNYSYEGWNCVRVASFINFNRKMMWHRKHGETGPTDESRISDKRKGWSKRKTFSNCPAAAANQPKKGSLPCRMRQQSIERKMMPKKMVDNQLDEWELWQTAAETQSEKGP